MRTLRRTPAVQINILLRALRIKLKHGTYYYPAEIDEEGRLRVDFSGPMTPESEELAGSEHGMEE